MKNGVKIFIKNEELGKFLFVLRDDKPSIVEPNSWGLVGGGIEESESPIDAIKSKIKNEVGIDVFDINQIYEMDVTHSLEGKEYKIKGYYFLGKTKASLADIKLNKGQKASFFTLEEIKRMENVSFAVKEIVNKHNDLLE